MHMGLGLAQVAGQAEPHSLYNCPTIGHVESETAVVTVDRTNIHDTSEIGNNMQNALHEIISTTVCHYNTFGLTYTYKILYTEVQDSLIDAVEMNATWL